MMLEECVRLKALTPVYIYALGALQLFKSPAEPNVHGNSATRAGQGMATVARGLFDRAHPALTIPSAKACRISNDRLPYWFIMV